MVHEDDVLHGGVTKKKARAIFDAQLKEFTAGMKSYEAPAREDLEGSVQAHTKCPKCQGPVSALIEDVNPSATFAYDLDILVSIKCSDAVCAWGSRQWRSWTRTKPKEL